MQFVCREGSLADLAATLKAALQLMLQSLRQPSSSSSQQVPTAVDVTRTTLDYLNNLLGWRAEQQSAGAQDWCSERWRPVVDLLLGWAPRLFGQCLDHFTLTSPEAVQPSHAGSEAIGCPVEEAVTIVLLSEWFGRVLETLWPEMGLL